MNRVYKVKRSITLPLILAVILSIPVFALSVRSDAATAKLVWTFILMLLFYGFALNKIIQRVSMVEDRLEFRSMFGRRNIGLDDIRGIEGATMGSRQFIILNTGGAPRHFSNSLDGFNDLTADLMAATPPTVHGEGLHEIVNHPIINRRDALAPWIAVLVLLMLLFANLPL